jgi:DNA uptake protein ComE-like DNA-binding protein
MFGVYLDGLRQAEDLFEKGDYDEAMNQLNLLEKGVELNDIEKLAAMLLNCQIMIKIGDYEKSFLLAKTAFRKSIAISHPLLVIDSTITFLDAINGLGLLYDASNKDQKEFVQMVNRSEDILKTITDLSKKNKGIRTEHLGRIKGIIEYTKIKTVPVKKDKAKAKIASFPIEKVKGVGQKAVELRKAGFKDASQLALAKVEELTPIKGIGPASAKKLIESAKELLNK